MTLQDLGSIGELVAAIATIGTLIYLALQIKHNTGAVRNQLTYGLVSANSDATELMASNAELASILARGTYDRDALTREEELRFNSFLFSYLNKVEFAFDQYLAGGIEERAWRKLEREIPMYLSLPGMNAWWEQDKVRFSDEFVAYLDDKIARQAPVSRPPTIPSPDRADEGNAT